MSSRQTQFSKPKLVVVARPEDLADNVYDGFVVRHRRIVDLLVEEFEIAIVWLCTREQDPPSVPWPVESRRHVVETWAISGAGRLHVVWRSIRRAESPAERDLGALVETLAPDAVLTVSPWLDLDYEPIFRRFRTIHFFEEDWRQLAEFTSHGWRARVLQLVVSALHVLSTGQPKLVVSISPRERQRARRRYPRSRHLYLPFALATGVPGASGLIEEASYADRKILTVGVYTHDRNARGLAAVLDDIERRGLGGVLRVRVVSELGLHDCLARHAGSGLLEVAEPGSLLSGEYRRAWAALVPSFAVTGQKTTILQAWSEGCPVVTTRAAARSVGARDDLLAGSTPKGVVDCLLMLREDERLRSRLVEGGHRAIARAHDPDIQRDWLLAAISRVTGMA